MRVARPAAGADYLAGCLGDVVPDPFAHERGLVDSPCASQLPHGRGLDVIQAHHQPVPRPFRHEHRFLDDLEFGVEIGEVMEFAKYKPTPGNIQKEIVEER